jgi:hypothetical protein
MQKPFEAVYENKVLRPVTVAGIPDPVEGIAAYFDADEWQASKTDTISLAEVRQAKRSADRLRKLQSPLATTGSECRAGILPRYQCVRKALTV